MLSETEFFKRRLCGVVFAAAVLLVLKPVSAAPPRVKACPPASRWHIAETSNFRILVYGAQPAGVEIGQQCETLRGTLCEKWLGKSSPQWTPKCDIVLHSSDASYLGELGQGAASTLASSLVEQKVGRIALRRIDIRASRAGWRQTALPHEMTHVVLADCFKQRPLPRWIDEGMAILADPEIKQAGHRKDLDDAIKARASFRVVELISMEDYPAAQRWGTFYGQSASLVEYLVSQSTPDRFVQFVRLSMDNGYESALTQVYQIDNVMELERRWRAHLSGTGVAKNRQSPPATVVVKLVPVGLVRGNTLSAGL